MIPPLVRRCPECGHLGLSCRFAAGTDSPGLLECPACGHRFEPPEDPRLN